MHLPHGFYLLYHHFDFLLLDFPLYHLIMLVIALLILWRGILNGRRLKRIEYLLKDPDKQFPASANQKAL